MPWAPPILCHLGSHQYFILWDFSKHVFLFAQKNDSGISSGTKVQPHNHQILKKAMRLFQQKWFSLLKCHSFLIRGTSDSCQHDWCSWGIKIFVIDHLVRVGFRFNDLWKKLLAWFDCLIVALQYLWKIKQNARCFIWGRGCSQAEGWMELYANIGMLTGSDNSSKRMSLPAHASVSSLSVSAPLLFQSCVYLT